MIERLYKNYVLRLEIWFRVSVKTGVIYKCTVRTECIYIILIAVVKDVVINVFVGGREKTGGCECPNRMRRAVSTTPAILYRSKGA